MIINNGCVKIAQVIDKVKMWYKWPMPKSLEASLLGAASIALASAVRKIPNFSLRDFSGA